MCDMYTFYLNLISSHLHDWVNVLDHFACCRLQQYLAIRSEQKTHVNRKSKTINILFHIVFNMFPLFNNYF